MPVRNPLDRVFEALHIPPNGRLAALIEIGLGIAVLVAIAIAAVLLIPVD
jgi:hypothetical protein